MVELMDSFSFVTKRRLDPTEQDSSSNKRMRQTVERHHTIRAPFQPLPTNEPAITQSEVVDKLLVDSVKAVCEEQALKQNITQPVIESVALEAFRNAVDEFILKFCSKVCRSMVSARRTAPIATDFESAIYALEVQQPDDQLKPYDTQPEVNRSLLPTPPPEDPFHGTVQLPSDFLGPELDGQRSLNKFSFNTLSLPALPSAHTFKDTAVFPKREMDTRRVRELATEEGKMGEQALRKLAGAVKLDATHAVEPERDTRKPQVTRFGRRRKKIVPSEETVFEETMRDLLKNEPGGFELGPIVTAEKAYRLPEDIQLRRQPTAKT